MKQVHHSEILPYRARVCPALLMAFGAVAFAVGVWSCPWLVAVGAGLAVAGDYWLASRWNAAWKRHQEVEP